MGGEGVAMDSDKLIDVNPRLEMKESVWLSHFQYAGVADCFPEACLPAGVRGAAAVGMVDRWRP